MPTETDTRHSILAAGQQIMAHKGWTAVGLTEILKSAGVPKGSFYHFFESKDAFGEAMMTRYFIDYLAEMDALFAQQSRSAADRLMEYWEGWRATQSLEDCQGRCLAVKLGAEVADLSEPIRLALAEGTAEIVARIEKMIVAGTTDGSLAVHNTDPHTTAQNLYDLWLGASVMAKIHRSPVSMDNALSLTAQILHR